MFKSINGGKLPQRATKYSAGFDVFANEDVVIGAGETKLIGLGIAIDQDWSVYFEKQNIGIDDGIHDDSDLIKVADGVTALGVLGGYNYKLCKGDKIGQLILKRHEGYLLPQEYTLDVQRTSGFGSTGA